VPGEELAHRGMRLPRTLELRNVSAVELDVARAGQGSLDMLHEREGHQRVVATPDEQRVALQVAQSRPEAAVAVGLVEVDVARSLIKGRPAARRQVAAQELIDARRNPAIR
jgi:hypothetical protein